MFISMISMPKCHYKKCHNILAPPLYAGIQVAKKYMFLLSGDRDIIDIHIGPTVSLILSDVAPVAISVVTVIS